MKNYIITDEILFEYSIKINIFCLFPFVLLYGDVLINYVFIYPRVSNTNIIYTLFLIRFLSLIIPVYNNFIRQYSSGALSENVLIVIIIN